MVVFGGVTPCELQGKRTYQLSGPVDGHSVFIRNISASPNGVTTQKTYYDKIMNLRIL
jgi:hypothetical protein